MVVDPQIIEREGGRGMQGRAERKREGEKGGEEERGRGRERGDGGRESIVITGPH